MLESLKDENGALKKPVLFSLIGAAGLVGYLILKGGGISGASSQSSSSPLTPDLSALQTAIDDLASGATGNGTGSGNTTTPPSGGATTPISSVGTVGPIKRVLSGGGSTSTTGTHRATLADLKARLDLHQLHVLDKEGLKALIPLLDPSQLHLLHLISTGGSVQNYTGQTMSPGATQATPTSLYSTPVQQSVPGESGNAGGGGAGLFQVAHPVASSPGVYSGLAGLVAVPVSASPVRRASLG